MASEDEVKRLAALARIQISDEELPAFASEFESVLKYVGTIEELKVSAKPNTRPALRNVLREDGEAHESGAYTDTIVAQFPDKEGNALKVKKIISHD